jgi:hypothetical protein
MNKLDQVRNYLDGSGIDMKSRKQEHLFRRYYLMYYLRKCYKAPLESIGRLFNKDHATIINAIKQYEILKGDKDFKDITEDERLFFPLNSEGTEYYEAEIISVNMPKTLISMDLFLNKRDRLN